MPDSGSIRLYTLDVVLIGGPVTEEFVRANKVVSRTIQIRGNQTLERLHAAIFRAFDREEEHLYEFQFGVRKPMSPRARRYVSPMGMYNPFPERHPAKSVARTKFDSLGLRRGMKFFYWFDFGDDWWHEIKVVSVEDEAPRGRYPKITGRVGESPPQYIDWEEVEQDDA